MFGTIYKLLFYTLQQYGFAGWLRVLTLRGLSAFRSQKVAQLKYRKEEKNIWLSTAEHIATSGSILCWAQPATSRSADPNGSPHQMVGSADILLSLWWIISSQLLLPLDSPTFSFDSLSWYSCHFSCHLCLVCSVRGSWWSSNFFCHSFFILFWSLVVKKDRQVGVFSPT